MAALGAARDTQQTQADVVRARAGDIQKRAETYAELMRRLRGAGQETPPR